MRRALQAGRIRRFRNESISEREADRMKDVKEQTGKTSEEVEIKPDGRQGKVSETWAEETIADLDDFIESQGIYIRQ